MPPSNGPSKSTKSSINHSWMSLNLKLLELPTTSCTGGKTSKEVADAYPITTTTILSTANLVSALGGIWRTIGYRPSASKAEELAPRLSSDTHPYGLLWRGSELEHAQFWAIRRWLLFNIIKGFKPEKLGSFSYPVGIHWRANEKFFLRLMELGNCGGSRSNSSNCVGINMSNVVRDDHVDEEMDAVELKLDSKIVDRCVDLHIDFVLSRDRAIRESSAMCSSLNEKCSCVGDVAGNGESEVLHASAIFEEGDASVMPSVDNMLVAALVRKKFAIAGAMAGSFVSLCLHPVDTVKTVTQARGVGAMSISSTVRSIVTERGIFGLYRGISSNIAFAAPISALYTFVYEVVKGALLPTLPKEYQFLAHCTAGGCASVATSFIFTPSDCIKQQMQVRCTYANCWDALVRILEKGGLRSLYAGWSAVLCRNIPHSIIKFYTYEALKQHLLPPSEASLSTFQTLLCGGIAGSAAAMFSTPFDVVKTRLQTQVAGSSAKANGVFHMLNQIARSEGLCGIYRGLSPRLLMYVSQGAIFFTSYEFFKAMLSLELPSSKPSEDSIDG